jgi:hypothetical protein
MNLIKRIIEKIVFNFGDNLCYNFSIILVFLLFISTFLLIILKINKLVQFLYRLYHDKNEKKLKSNIIFLLKNHIKKNKIKFLFLFIEIICLFYYIKLNILSINFIPLNHTDMKYNFYILSIIENNAHIPTIRTGLIFLLAKFYNFLGFEYNPITITSVNQISMILLFLIFYLLMKTILNYLSKLFYSINKQRINQKKYYDKLIIFLSTFISCVMPMFAFGIFKLKIIYFISLTGILFVICQIITFLEYKNLDSKFQNSKTELIIRLIIGILILYLSVLARFEVVVIFILIMIFLILNNLIISKINLRKNWIIFLKEKFYAFLDLKNGLLILFVTSFIGPITIAFFLLGSDNQRIYNTISTEYIISKLNFVMLSYKQIFLSLSNYEIITFFLIPILFLILIFLSRFLKKQHKYSNANFLKSIEIFNIVFLASSSLFFTILFQSSNRPDFKLCFFYSSIFYFLIIYKIINLFCYKFILKQKKQISKKAIIIIILLILLFQFILIDINKDRNMEINNSKVYNQTFNLILDYDFGTNLIFAKYAEIYYELLFSESNYSINNFYYLVNEINIDLIKKNGSKIVIMSEKLNCIEDELKEQLENQLKYLKETQDLGKMPFDNDNEIKSYVSNLFEDSTINTEFCYNECFCKISFN